MKLSQLIHIVSQDDANERKQAEKSLCFLRKTDPSRFEVQCSHLIKDDGLTEKARTESAKLLIDCIMTRMPWDASSGNLRSRYLWDTILADSKIQIRGNLLTALANPSVQVRQNASMALSRIVALEAQHSECYDLIKTLISVAVGTDQNHKQTALLTIGLICEQFQEQAVKIPGQLEKQMLGALVHSLRDSQPAIKLLSLQAMLHCPSFMHNIFGQDAVRNLVQNILLESIMTVDRATSRAALKCLSEFAKFNLEHLQEHVKVLLRDTLPIIESLSIEAADALSLWKCIGQEYLNRVNRTTKYFQRKEPGNNLLLEVHKVLLPVVLHCLTVIDGKQNEVRKAAFETLKIFAEVCEGVVLRTVSTFVSNAIQSEDPNTRQAGCLAMSVLYICYKSDDKRLADDMLAVVLEKLMEKLADLSLLVVESAAVALSDCIKSNPSVFLFHVTLSLTQKNSDTFVAAMFKAARLSNPIHCHISEGLTQLAQALGCEENEKCSLKRNLEPFLMQLLKIGLTATSPNAILECFIAIADTLRSCTDYLLASSFMDRLMDSYHQFEGTGQLHENVRWGILDAINPAILIFRDGPIVEFDFMDKVFAFVCDHFNRYNKVDNGISIICSLAIVFRERFAKHLDQSWTYIMYTLNEELAFHLPASFNSKLPEAIRVCIGLIRSNPGLELTCTLFLTLSGSVVRSDIKRIIQYSQQLLEAIDVGFQSVAELQNGDSQLANDLKNRVIELYQILGMSQFFNNLPSFRESYKKLIAFVVMTTRPELDPTIQYLSKCMQVLWDILYCFVRHDHKSSVTNELRGYLNCPELNEVMRLLHAHRSTNAQVAQLLRYGQRVMLN